MAKLLVYLKEVFLVFIFYFGTINSMPLVRYSKPTNSLFEALVSNPLFSNKLSWLDHNIYSLFSIYYRIFSVYLFLAVTKKMGNSLNTYEYSLYSSAEGKITPSPHRNVSAPTAPFAAAVFAVPIYILLFFWAS